MGCPGGGAQCRNPCTAHRAGCVDRMPIPERGRIGRVRGQNAHARLHQSEAAAGCRRSTGSARLELDRVDARVRQFGQVNGLAAGAAQASSTRMPSPACSHGAAAEHLASCTDTSPSVKPAIRSTGHGRCRRTASWTHATGSDAFAMQPGQIGVHIAAPPIDPQHESRPPGRARQKVVPVVGQSRRIRSSHQRGSSGAWRRRAAAAAPERRAAAGTSAAPH